MNVAKAQCLWIGMFAGVLSVGTATAQDAGEGGVAVAPPSAAAPPSATAPPSGPADSETAPKAAELKTKAKAALDTDRLKKVHGLFEKATKAFGDEHVTLTPAFYAAQLDEAPEGSAKGSFGVAGMVGVPLFGLGGGHGCDGDLWPIVTTKTQAETIEAFDGAVSTYFDTFNNVEATADDLEAAVDALESLADLYSTDHAEFEPSGLKASNALGQLVASAKGLSVSVSGTVKMEDLFKPAEKTPDNASPDKNAEESMWASLEAGYTAAKDECGTTVAAVPDKFTSWVELTVQDVDTMATFLRNADTCFVAAEVVDRPVVREAARVAKRLRDSTARELLLQKKAGKDIKVDINASSKAFKSLRASYAALRAEITANNDGSVAPRRHNLLIGPTVGVPLGVDTPDLYLYGGQVEIGWTGLRFAFSGGGVGAYKGDDWKKAAYQGWFMGLGLSGEFGDDLFHTLNGGMDLAREFASATQATADARP